ncbi:hypothetical protein PoB_003345500 [Plakobranchus ocellatus]|uniref:Uncharacterized protein n=1 Tax=Plakobranchus ocellatus TaxID=259542 RepID=A0AAV4AHY6_9GAST|nr:hypothetical protein PoB_003345500 [Plakobranchus ocellatus]
MPSRHLLNHSDSIFSFKSCPTALQLIKCLEATCGSNLQGSGIIADWFSWLAQKPAVMLDVLFSFVKSMSTDLDPREDYLIFVERECGAIDLNVLTF